MGTHPIFESDFDCLTEEKTVVMLRLNWARFLSTNRSLHERITVQAANANDVGEDFVTVPAGPNAGLKIKTSVNNRNPRNLEMLNLARRDTGWGAGPTLKKTNDECYTSRQKR